MCKPTFLTGCLFLATILVTGMILAYPVRYPFNLDQLNKQADVILKVTVVDSKPVENDWFETAPGFKVVATEMNVISSVKGELTHDTIQFHHYTEVRDGLAAMYMP